MYISHLEAQSWCSVRKSATCFLSCYLFSCFGWFWMIFFHSGANENACGSCFEMCPGEKKPLFKRNASIQGVFETLRFHPANCYGPLYQRKDFATWLDIYTWNAPQDESSGQWDIVIEHTHKVFRCLWNSIRLLVFLFCDRIVKSPKLKRFASFRHSCAMDPKKERPYTVVPVTVLRLICSGTSHLDGGFNGF